VLKAPYVTAKHGLIGLAKVWPRKAPLLLTMTAGAGLDLIFLAAFPAYSITITAPGGSAKTADSLTCSKPCTAADTLTGTSMDSGPDVSLISKQLSQSRLVEPARWSRSSRRLAALKRRISSSRASFFSWSRVVLDLGASVPRNFSRAWPTESLVVSAMAKSFMSLNTDSHRTQSYVNLCWAKVR
jgi:hypothetical protein